MMSPTYSYTGGARGQPKLLPTSPMCRILLLKKGVRSRWESSPKVHTATNPNIILTTRRWCLLQAALELHRSWLSSETFCTGIVLRPPTPMKSGYPRTLCWYGPCARNPNSTSFAKFRQVYLLAITSPAIFESAWGYMWLGYKTI